MITLALDSTANTASCALAREGRLLALSTVDGIRTHSETLLPMIEHILSEAALTLADVGLFAASEGPGSFTGVRIGVAALKGLAFGQGKPCVGVSTLAALARNLEALSESNGSGPLIVPVMDARRQQVYTAIFQGSRRLTDDLLIPLSELRELLGGLSGQKIYFCGDGYDLAHRFFADDPRVAPTPALLIVQNALSVALCAEDIFAASEDKSAFTDANLSPRYLRASQAERERLEK